MNTLWFIGIAAAYLALGYALRRWPWTAPFALLVGAALFVGTAYLELLIILDEDDWWDDFRSQNRMTVLVPILQIVAVVGGASLGWSIAS